MLNGYFRVNENLQSTSHPNVFAAGDCITIDKYAHIPNFPPKAGVYAVRAGPIVSKNVVNYINEEPLVPYVPQTGFLSLLMTGDSSAVGTKFGIAFSGKWVWEMKDYIDKSFMKLFDPTYLFKNYSTKRFEEPCEEEEMIMREKKAIEESNASLKARVEVCEALAAAQSLKCPEDETEFFEKLFIIDRMARDEVFQKEVIKHYTDTV